MLLTLKLVLELNEGKLVLQRVLQLDQRLMLDL
nr:hypothetical protein Q903MT_gene1148 [Picea sitchensis]